MRRKAHKVTSSSLRDYARIEQPVFVIDIETTGLSRSDEIVELGLYDILNEKEHSFLSRPKRKSANATAFVTGISDDMLIDAPSIDDVLVHVNEEVTPIRDTLFIAHNGISFDFPRINDAIVESRAFNGRIDPDNTVDSMILAQQMIPYGSIATYKLETLIDYYGITGKQIHRAGSDCAFTSKVVDAILDDERRCLPLSDIIDFITVSHSSRRSANRFEKSAREALLIVENAAKSKNINDEALKALYDNYARRFESAYMSRDRIRELSDFVRA